MGHCERKKYTLRRVMYNLDIILGILVFGCVWSTLNVYLWENVYYFCYKKYSLVVNLSNAQFVTFVCIFCFKSSVQFTFIVYIFYFKSSMKLTYFICMFYLHHLRQVQCLVCISNFIQVFLWDFKEMVMDRTLVLESQVGICNRFL